MTLAKPAMENLIFKLIDYLNLHENQAIKYAAYNKFIKLQNQNIIN